jgi:DNA-binding HxlR family transcriptional regulator
VTRHYDDRCGIAQALNLVGDRWALLIVRDLLLGPKRFTDLQAGLPGAGSNRLTQRLHDLETAGVVHRRVLPPPAGSQVYELTEWGKELDPIVTALGTWRARQPMPVDAPLGADSAMLELRAFFTPDPERVWTATYEIRLGRDRFTARVVDGRLTEVVRGQPAGKPDGTLDTDPATLGDIVESNLSTDDAIRSDRLTLTGDDTANRALIDAITRR